MSFKSKKRGLENLKQEILSSPKVNDLDKDLVRRGTKIPELFNPYTGEITWKSNQEDEGIENR